MSANNKTEKPTPKKKRDAAKEGQTFKSKDLITTCMMLIGIEFIIRFVSVSDFGAILKDIIEHDFQLTPAAYIWLCVKACLWILIPVMVVAIFFSSVPALALSGLVMATKALKLDFNSLNPAQGFKKIFSIRMLKEVAKALLYLASFYAAALWFWSVNKQKILSMLYGTPESLLVIWGQLLQSLILILIACILIILVLDSIAEFLMYYKQIMMDKTEIKKESKETEGNPQIKSKRRELHHELLQEEVKENIRKSKAIIANPTHIAVGIYVHPGIEFMPFISVLEKNNMALLVRQYAKEIGVPVIENVPLARAIYANSKVHNFVNIQQLGEVLAILSWLKSIDES
jgi:type III secretion protein, YscU/HrpY family